MKVLIGCEESQTECLAFRELGYEAYSCDIKPCSGGHPEFHIQDDVLTVIENNHWDLLIAHPPCTYLSLVGQVNEKRHPDRIAAGYEALEFFKKLLYCNIDHIAIENPKMQSKFLSQLPYWTQRIQPYMFGEPYTKYTCLWLKNLPCLEWTSLFCSDPVSWTSLSRDSTTRSKSFNGIAKAMANQWGSYVCSHIT